MKYFIVVLCIMDLALCGFIAVSEVSLSQNLTTILAALHLRDSPVAVNAQALEPTRAPSPTSTRPLSSAPTIAPASPFSIIGPEARAGTVHVPAYDSFDFLTGYLGNATYPIIVDGKPWDNGSTNFVQYQKLGEGTSYWDYWTDTDAWESPNHLWRDDQGTWHTYKTETIKDSSGRNITAFFLVDRKGPGVMDKLWFTNEPVRAFISILTMANIFLSTDPPDLKEWGNLQKLGNLLIQVDGQTMYDGPIEQWYSGNAQHLSPALKSILVLRYNQFGSDGNIIPITYQNHLKVMVYGGVSKPSWFMATGLSLPSTIHLVSSTGDDNDLPIERMDQLAANVLKPEDYVQALPNHKEQRLVVKPNAPAEIALSGAGTLAAIQFEILKPYDPRLLWLKVQYGNETGIDLPLTAFFGEADQVSLHHSTPVGILDTGNTYLFYSNWPMPFQNGIKVQVSVNDAQAILVQMRYATTAAIYNTQLRVAYPAAQKLSVYGPDYQVNLSGNGKLVGLVLVTRDQQFDKVPKIINPQTGVQDTAKMRWPMGYLEGNLTITDGAGNNRYYSGLEDWAEGGYYFNSGYTTPPGGSNRPFAGILRYKEGRDGYATLFRYFGDLSAFPFKNGLQLAFGHGTWQNNFPVTYGATLFYYLEIQGLASTFLPASTYIRP